MRKPFGRPSIFWGCWPLFSCCCCCFFFSLFFLNSHALTKQGKDKCYSSCGPLVNITYPFRLKQDPQGCGRSEPLFELTCENNTTQPIIHLPPRRYYVKEISYQTNEARVVDPGLETSSLPLYNSPPYFPDLYNLSLSDCENCRLLFVNCSQPVNHPSYVATAPCNLSSPHAHVYAMKFGSISVSQLHTSCRVVMNLPVISGEIGNLTSCSAIHHVLIRGFRIYWREGRYCQANETFRRMRSMSSCMTGRYSLRYDTALTFALEIIGVLVGKTGVGVLCLSLVLVYKIRTRHIWMDTTVEEFLTDYRFQMPTRYSYANIKNMTKHFREELGRGGYGSVFKGKLSTGDLVAIKMLKNSKGNGQEFINEVATIGRIHHVNVVRLIGFCSEGSKRALIYEFMANGSLDKHIFTQEKFNFLCWNKMYHIALGIARGIEYLHRGCDMRILHFDIKPHNILLDENFIPKVSDFGLAKFYPTEDSLVSVTAARGTIGYIAPELLYKTLGGVSHKSDVYSFGMMLLEMTGRRKNIDAFAEHSSQIYFPLWAYDQLNKGEDLVMVDITDNDKEIAKKLMIVALWCIQMKPTERPSMSKVIEMLEGSIEDLHIPAKPLLSSSHKLDDNHSPNMEPGESTRTHKSGSISQEFLESDIVEVLDYEIKNN